VYKLARAVDASDSLVAVLDDDTVLPPGTLGRAATLLAEADLVTGIPYYLVGGGVWSRLVAAFVNGSALLTYLPLSLVGPPVSINGMFYLTTRAALERAGGFAAVEDRVCDDYELAALYRRAGLRLVQASLPHPLRTSVPSASAYARIIRRWLVFSLRLLRDEANPALAALVVAPSLAPGAALACAVAARRPVLAVATLAAVVAKSLATAQLRQDLIDIPASAEDLGLEAVSDLLLPLHLLAAVAARGRITWRGKPMRIGRDGRVGQRRDPHFDTAEGPQAPEPGLRPDLRYQNQDAGQR
jgi:ceramide glucosyltransferase